MPRRQLLDEGRDALQRGAWAEARHAFERALAEERTGEAFEGLGWALYWLDDLDRSLMEREQAYRAYLDRGDRAAAARVAVGLGVGSFDVRGDSVASGWIERAGQLLRGVPQSIDHGWLALYQGHFARLVPNDLAKSRRLAKKAAGLGRRFGEPQLELLARALEGLVLVSEGDVAEGMRRVDEATAAAMAGEMRDLDAVAQTCCILLFACDRVRDYKRAAEWQVRINQFCRQWGIEPLFAVCRTQHAAMQIGCGEWKEAERQLEDALDRLAKARPFMIPDVLVQLAELRRRQGRYDEALDLARRVETRTESLLTRAAIEIDRGDAGRALEFSERVLARPLGEKWFERACALQIVVRAALLARHRPRAQRALDDVQAIARRVSSPAILAMARLAEGVMSASAGDHDDARGAFVDAVQLFAASNAPFETASARVMLARELGALGRAGLARDELDQATAAFQNLGATGELQRIRAETARNQEILTPREREVLHLIAGGLGDKQLAVRLSLSEHTVHRHVANILRKLDVTSRSAAVARAARGGWLGS